MIIEKFFFPEKDDVVLGPLIKDNVVILRSKLNNYCILLLK